MLVIDNTRPSFTLDLEDIDPELILNGAEYITQLIEALNNLKQNMVGDYCYSIRDHHEYGTTSVLDFTPVRLKTHEEIAAETAAAKLTLISKTSGEKIREVDPEEYQAFYAWRQAKMAAESQAVIDKLAEAMSRPNEVHPDYLEWQKNRERSSL